MYSFPRTRVPRSDLEPRCRPRVWQVDWRGGSLPWQGCAPWPEGVNIFRTPLCGRNFEYMGEDPYLAASMVVPYVQGVQSNGVSTCVKHFALNNNEVNRHTSNPIVDDRTLYEIYFPAFKAAADAGLGALWAVTICSEASMPATTPS